MIQVKLIDEPVLKVNISEIIQPGKSDTFTVGNGLKLENNTLSVDTANAVEVNNTKPVTSAAVYTEIGNIEALLAIL